MLLSDVWHLSVTYIRPKSRTERPRKTKICTEVAHVTRDSDTTFKVKRSKVKVTRPLGPWLSAALTCKAAAAVSVGTYSAWESTATLRLLGGAWGAHGGRREAGAYRVATRRACYLLHLEAQLGWADFTIGMKEFVNVGNWLLSRILSNNKSPTTP